MKAATIALLISTTSASSLMSLLGLRNDTAPADDIHKLPAITSDEGKEMSDLENGIKYELINDKEDHDADKAENGEVEGADSTNPEVTEPGEDYANPAYQSNMTLDTWKQYSKDDQLTLYK